MVLPLKRGDEVLGMLVLGRRGDEHPDSVFTNVELALLNHLSSYMALTIAHARTRDEHQAVMVTLTEQSKMLRQQQELLSKQAAEAVRQVEDMVSQGHLRVSALGPLHVERDSEKITRWGGNKAGTYQAEALFAFLFTRRGKGITKDEAEEVIWPDLEIAKADSAFHRTLAALRRTLEPGLRRGNQSKTILYHHDRYWLAPETVSWCDTDAFIDATERGINLFHQNDHDAALHALETASELYRGDYMDDCPFFGDSSYVEDERSMLRARALEVYLALGAIYEAKGRAGEAATAYRQALALSVDECPPATEGLARLQEGLAG